MYLIWDRLCPSSWWKTGWFHSWDSGAHCSKSAVLEVQQSLPQTVDVGPIAARAGTGLAACEEGELVEGHEVVPFMNRFIRTFEGKARVKTMPLVVLPAPMMGAMRSSTPPWSPLRLSILVGPDLGPGPHASLLVADVINVASGGWEGGEDGMMLEVWQ